MRTSLSVDAEFKMVKTQPVRHRWKRALTLTEQKEYDKYLQQLREKHPSNAWRIQHDKRYHRACKDGFMQRCCNLNNFVKETCVQGSADSIIK